MLRSFIRKYPLLIILTFAFLIRIIYFVCIIIRNPDGIYVFDSYGYWQIAFNVREYGIFSQSYDFPIEPDYFRTPVYPLFIILSEALGPEGFSIIVFQILLGVLTCYFTYKIARELTGSDFISNISALIIAIDIPSIVMNNLVLTETLFTFLLIISSYVFIRFLKTKKISSLIISSILCGASILCRPIGFFLPLLFVVAIAFNMRKELKKVISHSLIFCFVCLLAVSPWLIRNKITFNHFFSSVIREHVMLNYEAGSIYAEKNNIPLAEAQSILRWKTFREFQGEADKKPYEYAGYIEKEALKIMFDNPEILIKHQLKQFLHFYLKPCRAYIDIQLGNWGKGYNTIPKNYPIFEYLFRHNSKLTITLVLFQILVLAICYLVFFFGILYLFRTKQNVTLFFLVGLIFCFSVCTLSEITESRFRVPVMPYISIISATGICFLKEWYENKSVKK
jgi:4-amino-4-deoxy-L-arabinose transferase-like glycosyltransferase